MIPQAREVRLKPKIRKVLEARSRAGKKPIYGQATNKRILALLEEPPPQGYARWTGSSARPLTGIAGQSPTAAGCAVTARPSLAKETAPVSAETWAGAVLMAYRYHDP